MGKVKDYFNRKKEKKEEIAAAKAQAKANGNFVPGIWDRLFGGIKGTYDTARTLLGVGGSIKDILSRIKDNKAHIDRRLTIIFIFISLVTAVVTAVNFVVSGVLDRTVWGWNIAVYTVISLYFPVIVALFIAETVYRRNITLKTTEKYNGFLKVMRLVIRIVAFIMSVMSLIISAMIGDVEGKALAIDILARVFSIVTIICSVLPSATSVIKKFAMWLISPVNGKVSFGWVAGQWKENVDIIAASKNKEQSAEFDANDVVKLQVAKRLKIFKKINADDAQVLYDLIDDYIIKSFKGKYIINIRENEVYCAVEKVPEESRADVFEMVDSIFEFAIVREIIEENPCVGLRDFYSSAKKAGGDGSSADGILGKLFGRK